MASLETLTASTLTEASDHLASLVNQVAARGALLIGVLIVGLLVYRLISVKLIAKPG